MEDSSVFLCVINNPTLSTTPHLLLLFASFQRMLKIICKYCDHHITTPAILDQFTCKYLDLS